MHFSPFEGVDLSGEVNLQSSNIRGAPSPFHPRLIFRRGIFTPFHFWGGEKVSPLQISGGDFDGEKIFHPFFNEFFLYDEYLDYFANLLYII